MKFAHILGSVAVLLVACQSQPVFHEPEGDRIASVDVVLKKISPLTVDPDCSILKRAQIRAIADIVERKSIWIKDPSSKVAPMPDADGYQYWLILRFDRSETEIIGVKEAELVRNGFRASITKKELKRLAKACDLVTIGPFELD
jgi:hypothetical protein